MTIDIERLKVDREYWDSVAPEGATAYDDQYVAPWRKSDEGCEFYFSEALKNWVSTIRKDCARIPRPEPRQVEWDGEGLPPVGCECEVYPYFEKCRICCEYDGGVIVHNLHDDGFFHAKNDGKYRFRTKEQRERDELAGLIHRSHIHPVTPCHAGKIADAILAHYNLEPKQ